MVFYFLQLLGALSQECNCNTYGGWARTYVAFYTALSEYQSTCKLSVWRVAMVNPATLCMGSHELNLRHLLDNVNLFVTEALFHAFFTAKSNKICLLFWNMHYNEESEEMNERIHMRTSQYASVCVYGHCFLNFNKQTIAVKK